MPVTTQGAQWECNYNRMNHQNNLNNVWWLLYRLLQWAV